MMNLTYLLQQSDPVLTATFLLLIGMSFISWYIILWKSWNLSREKRKLHTFSAGNAQQMDWPRESLIMHTNGYTQHMLNTLRAWHQDSAATLRKNDTPEALRQTLHMHLSQALDAIRTRLDTGLTYLASIGSSAPFIGLFGTVWGIYGALTRIAAEGNASLNVVAGPMGEALVATAIGLFAAIPAVLAYNAFVRMNRLLMQDFRHIAEQIAAYAPLPSATVPVKSAEALKLVSAEE